MRQSTNGYDDDGNLADGFDYALQVWVRRGIVQPCGHPAHMGPSPTCCNARKYAGLTILEAHARHQQEA